MFLSTIVSIILSTTVTLYGLSEMQFDDNATIVKKSKPIMIDGKKMLPLRVLVRPFSNIYAKNSLKSDIVMSNVPALKPFYVYHKPTPEEIELEDAWYQVGTNTRGKIVGWIQAKDLLEWKQTMCLVYTHPEGRKPLLMFDKESDLQSLLNLSEENRTKKVEEYYRAIAENQIPKNFPIKSIEPKRALDWKKEFYFLPILDFKAVEFGNREARILKLTASTNSRADARESTDITKNDSYRESANVKRTTITKKLIKRLKLDIVWVVDTTVSMRPYIDRTKAVIRDVSEKIAQSSDTNIAINFGIWGYRDNRLDIPNIGYTTRNYTDDLVPIEQFSQILESVETTKVDSVDYPEDLFSGMNNAINDTNWRDNTMRFIILVGDAPSHKSGHKWNLSGQDEKTLRIMANDRNINIFAIHIFNPKAKKFQELALEQYKTLSTNKGNTQPSFKEVLSTDEDQFQEFTDDITKVFTKSIQKFKEYNFASTNSNEKQSTHTDANKKVGGEMAFSEDAKEVDIDSVIAKDVDDNSSAKALAKNMFRSALVEWIGSQGDTKAPRDIVAWAIDKDLENPSIPSVEVRLLLNKRQLDSLATTLDSIITAGTQGSVSGEDFFSLLQATTAMVSRDPNMIRQAKRMTDTGLVPEFLMGLPYQSQLMAMDNELWDSLSVDEQTEFVDSMSSKVDAYRRIHDSPEGWIRINPDDDPDEYVYPISLDLLP
ncbi:PpkA [hydrothermal vent metagenome]|uniref:PpkA n=1 Tax=hydrothermal vent metagenome TaxID=652676 RepID=A0A1W1CD39_9ZZZZ